MPQDAGPIFDGYAQDTTVTRFVIWRPHRSRSDTEAYIAQCMATPPDVSRTYVLTDRTDGDVRGTFALRLAAPHRLDCGYALARAWWGRGLMTEVLTEVVNWALSQPLIFHIGAVCNVENIGSARVMEKAGLVREGPPGDQAHADEKRGQGTGLGERFHGAKSGSHSTLCWRRQSERTRL